MFKKELITTKQIYNPLPPTPEINSTDLLEKLFDELGSLKWVGKEQGWDNAVTAVRKRALELIQKNKG